MAGLQMELRRDDPQLIRATARARSVVVLQIHAGSQQIERSLNEGRGGVAKGIRNWCIMQNSSSLRERKVPSFLLRRVKYAFVSAESIGKSTTRLNSPALSEIVTMQARICSCRRQTAVSAILRRLATAATILTCACTTALAELQTSASEIKLSDPDATRQLVIIETIDGVQSDITRVGRMEDRTRRRRAHR